MQRIIYEIYRDRAAFESHERQPHIQRFVDDRKACVLATNIIDLRLKYAKVAALGTSQAPQESQPSQETQTTRAPRAVESSAAAPVPTPAGAGGFGSSGGRRGWPSDPAGDQYATVPASDRYATVPAGDQYSTTGTGRYSATSRYPELGAGRQSEDGSRYAEGSGQFPESGRDGYGETEGRSSLPQSSDQSQPSYQGQRYGGR